MGPSRHLFALLALAVCLSLASSAALAAPGNPPPLAPPDDVSPAGVGAEALALGQPGFSLRYVRSFGTTEEPYLVDNAHINGPAGLAVDQSDNVWITEQFGQRALRFDKDGTFLTRIGAPGVLIPDLQQPPGVDLQIRQLSDVAVDVHGDVWLVDSGVQYVLKLDSSGKYLSMLGQPYNRGQGDEQFAGPTGIAFDSARNLYVSDTDNQRVQVFDVSNPGSPSKIATIGTTGAWGSDDSHFNQPRRIAIDADDRLYVADSENHRVQIFDVSNPSSPSKIATIGTTGTPGGSSATLSRPEGVGVDGSYIYVADSRNHRVQIFDRETRAYVKTIGSGCTDFGGCQPSAGSDGLNYPTDVVVDSAGRVYVADQGNSRVQQFASGWQSKTLTYGTTGVPYLTDGSHVNQPVGVATAPGGSLFVTEEQGHRLLKLDATGAVSWQVGQAGVAGWDDEHLAGPRGVAFDSVAGRVYVVEGWQNRVKVLNAADGSLLGTIGPKDQDGRPGQENDRFAGPRGVAVAAQGRIYVADTGNHRVQVFKSDLSYLATIGVTGEPGDNETHLNQPQGVAVDSTGRIYVADQGNQRVQVFDQSSLNQTPPVAIRTIGVTGACNGANNIQDFEHLCNPAAVAVDSADRVYVADRWGNRVQVYDSNGAYLTTVGGDWSARADQLRSASGLAIDRDGNLFATDRDNSRVQKYARGVPGWNQVNLNGFGVEANNRVAALASFGGQLYAGTSNTANTGGQLWRRASDGSWAATVTDGFGNPRNRTIGSLVEFKGKLYAGTDNWDNLQGKSQGGELWRCQTCDGGDWQKVAEGGFGDANANEITQLFVFKDRIYAARSTGQLWRSDTGDPGTWTWAANLGVAQATIFGDDLYVGDFNNTVGGSVFRTSNGTNWTQVSQSGFGNPGVLAVFSLAAFDGYLYAATMPGNPNNPPSGSDVWRCQACDGSDWTKVVNGGFGNARTGGTSALRVFGGRLYFVVGNPDTGLEVWRTASGRPGEWEQVGFAGFGDSNNGGVYSAGAVTVFGNRLYVGTRVRASGGELWLYPDAFRVFLPLVARN